MHLNGELLASWVETICERSLAKAEEVFVLYSGPVLSEQPSKPKNAAPHITVVVKSPSLIIVQLIMSTVFSS